MPKKSQLSRSQRKLKYRTPGGKTRVIYKRKKSTAASCNVCKKKLQAVNTSKKKAKTEKRPTRMFTGELCGACAQKAVKLASRVRSGQIQIIDVDMNLKKYVEQIL